MKRDAHFGDGLVDEAKVIFNSRAKELLGIAMNMVFDFLKEKETAIPEEIKRLRGNPEIEGEIVAAWSEKLFEEGLILKGYNGLPDECLISNFRQDGYLGGLYAGYALAMMALVDNNAPEDLVIAARDYIRPNLLGHHYDDMEEFVNPYKDEKYSWIDKT